MSGLRLFGGWFGEQLVEAAREVALEAAQRGLGGLAFGLLAGEILLGDRVVVSAGDRDDVQRVIELAVAAQAMTNDRTRAGRTRRGPPYRSKEESESLLKAKPLHDNGS